MSAHGKCPHGQEATAPGYSVLCASCVEAPTEGERNAWEAYERLKEGAGEVVNKLLNKESDSEQKANDFLSVYDIERKRIEMTRTMLVMKVAAVLYHRATGNLELTIEEAWSDTRGDEAIRDEYIRTARAALAIVYTETRTPVLEVGRCECPSQGLETDAGANYVSCVRCGGNA